jgi:DNA (cytosine-5)-methyltransferase 1
LKRIPLDVSRNFNLDERRLSPFLDAGVYRNGMAYTLKAKAIFSKPKKNLGSVLQPTSEVDKRFFIPHYQLKEWQFLKGAKKLKRFHKTSGFTYSYSEGAIAFPDLLSNPARTILTGEGGSGASRFKHVVKVNNKFRRLTPIELERLNGFPDNWTKFDAEGHELSDARRGFFMGNALVVGLVHQIGRELIKDLVRNH